MITDQEVVQLFRNIVRTPIKLNASELIGSQLFRGIPGHLWKDAHPVGCIRHLAVFNKFNVIPKYCFDCCKVLITPRNVLELFKLLMIFEKIALPLDNTRKCLVEERKDCSGTYKGLIYCRGIKEGNEVRKIVRKAVSEDIAPQVSVTLKRGCSEFELAYPGYARIDQGSVVMQYRKDWQIHEDFVDKNMVFYQKPPDANAAISDVITDGVTRYTREEILCMQFWLGYAATISDMSYLAIAGMTMPPIPGLKRPPFKNTIPFKNK